MKVGFAVSEVKGKTPGFYVFFLEECCVLTENIVEKTGMEHKEHKEAQSSQRMF
jgi:hypothetical protein